MRIYPNILSGIAECLKSIFFLDKYTADVLEKAFKNNKKWGSRDRRFIAEAVFDIVRWSRFFSNAVHAEVTESDYCEKLIAVYLLKNGFELPDTYSLLSLNKASVTESLSSCNLPFVVKESIPDWLDNIGRDDLPDKWEKEISSLNEPAQVYLRANTLKVSILDLQEKLKSKEIFTHKHPFLPDCLVLQKRQTISSLKEYEEGLFEIQDAGSQEIAPFLNIEPEKVVIDACAGAGGKSLHIASLLQNSGKIISMDVEEKKLRILKERALRAGAVNIQTIPIAKENIENLKELADYLLLDVPCSGLGVIKRNPDAKWKLSQTEIDKTIALQQKILTEYPSMLKPGGTLVYATCSILPSENEKQVANFLKSQENKFVLEAEKHVWPSDGADGFYMARLKKSL